jgi:hypothetical protein
MTVICLEGASAVGKTTTARSLAEKHGAFVVPEVNRLFERPAAESPGWYYERQVDRWSMAREKSRSFALVVLDGDPLQPLWYNWAYHFADRQSLDFMARFYGPRIRSGEIGFPDQYYLLSTNSAELRRRRENDAGRLRRGFDFHLRMIEPQRRYFEAMNARAPGRARFLEAESIESNLEFIKRGVAFNTPPPEDPAALFDETIRWLRDNDFLIKITAKKKRRRFAAAFPGFQ